MPGYTPSLMHERELLSFESALARVLDAAPGLGLETVELARSPGRVLAEDIRCDRDVPAADVSAMDGFAVRSVDLVEPSSLRLVGDALAGRPYDGAVGPGECTRVMTGGLVPQGSDAVVPVEATSGYDALDGGRIEFSRGTAPGDNVRPRASVRKQGDVVLARGGVIRAPQIAVLAGQGHVRVQVARRPRVAILPTGDEVVPIDVVPTEGQVRNSNAHCLHAQVEAAGGEASLHAILRDREGDTLARLRDALETHDLVCTIGGVSMGTRDLVRGAFD
ncbi:MAG: molybdopterin molybdotransferase MoeA, partial [Planctomycetes bacterium]|nr:molybdopterin molybdotransferase MoeA [Planctomycetota bacterium]